MRGKSFAANANNLPVLGDHNAENAPDVVTTLFINFEWRRLISDALQSYADSIIRTLDDSLVDDFRNKFQALLNDLYTPDAMDTIPVGTIIAFANHTVIPAKWLLCNGSLVSQVTYPELYAICGTIYGAISGGNFRLPELRQRVIFGAVPGTPFYEQGEQGGVEATTISLSNLPEHHHVVPAHNHNFGTGGAVGGLSTSAARASNLNGSQVTDTEPATDTSDVGAGAPFNIMNPYLNVAYIIKALP